MKHLFLILLTITIWVTGIFLPYFHGDYDYFAVGLSYITQFAGFAALLFVPIGLIWYILDLGNRKNNETAKYPGYFRNITMIVTGIIILAGALGAFASKNRFSAIIILGVGIYTLLKISRKVKDLKSVNPGGHNFIPYYLIFIPMTVWFIRMTFIERVKNDSTDFVIKQSELLIQDIEAYKKNNGHYPLSIQSTIEDYKPAVTGIERFHYEPVRNAYNLYFEQFSDVIGTQEIVMYNKSGEHEMTVHNQDLLRIAPGNILRGYHKVVKMPQQNWKIFYFD